MNWNYDTLPGCDSYEKNNQVPFPACGANCASANDGKITPASAAAADVAAAAAATAAHVAATGPPAEAADAAALH